MENGKWKMQVGERPRAIVINVFLDLILHMCHAPLRVAAKRYGLSRVNTVAHLQRERSPTCIFHFPFSISSKLCWVPHPGRQAVLWARE